VLRFQRFLAGVPALARRATTLAAAAADAGYADQAHLTRDCHALSGSTPATLVARWAETFKTDRASLATLCG
jgi:AraC-like DNA-binding protein